MEATMSDRPEGSPPAAQSAEWLNGFGIGVRQGVLTGLRGAAELCRDLMEIVPEGITPPEALRDASIGIDRIAQDLEKFLQTLVSGRAH